MNTIFSGLERQNQIMQLLACNQRIRVTEICETFEVSEATARRDLEALAVQGKLQRVHGGAIPVGRAAPELPLLERCLEQASEKERIGKAAAAMVNNNETILLGSGTTVLEVAKNIREHKGLTVITNSLPVINTLSGLPEISVIVLGGMLRGSELSFIGHITEQALAEVRAEKVFIGTRAISLDQGLTNDYLQETMTDRAILKAGREVIVVADHSKFGRVAAALLAPLESVHTIVTDEGTQQEFLDAVQERGLRVVTA
ncbi:MAG: DeoR/GlpR family DNA-binding transcription regulator [Anaerolineales bacterium]|nr:DeoR/GlpR family DNA-binding transcription regulator [Anaerolineales bacterium]